MSAPTGKRLTGPERRKKLIHAAIEVFAQKGYELATVDEIAALASVTKPVLYDHFDSKEAVFIESISVIRDELLARGRHAISQQTASSQRLKAAISAFFDFIVERPSAARVLIMGSKGTPLVEQACRRVQADAIKAIASIMKANAPAFANSRQEEQTWFLKAEFVKKGMHGLAEWWLDHPKTPRADIEIALVEVLRKGVGLR